MSIYTVQAFKYRPGRPSIVEVYLPVFGVPRDVFLYMVQDVVPCTFRKKRVRDL